MFEIEIYRDGTSNFIAYTPALCWNNENVAVMYTSGISATETSSIVVEVTGQNGTALANEIIIDNFNVQYIAKD